MKTLPLFLLAFVAAAPAQEVTVTAPVWMRDDAPPDQLPERRHHAMPDYPREARKSGEVGYVLVERHVAVDGKAFNYLINGSQADLKREVLDDFRILEMKPGMRAGQPADSDVWFAFLFNPKSATQKGPDSTPRLLGVSPVWVPARSLSSPGNNPPVRTRLTIDEKGAVTGADVESSADARYLPAIREATAHWLFEPGRRGSQPVVSTIALPIVVSARPAAIIRGDVVPAHLVKRVPPFYPLRFRHFRIRAEVAVDFTITPQGNVENASIRSSTNPGFEEEALNAIKKWKYAPATKNGRPIATRASTTMKFQFFRDNRDMLEVRGTGSDLPPEFQYDTAPVIRGVILPAYPYEALRDDRTGSATVEVLIDPNGKVIRTKVTEATYPDFGQAMTAALEMYQFDPAMKDGKGTQSLLKRETSFNLDMPAPDTEGEDMLTDRLFLRRIEADPGRVTRADKLDHPLHPISQRAPLFPANLVGQTEHGRAIVEIVIDKDGRARIPKVLSSSDPAFGYAAAQAAIYWRFDPPKAGGKSVVTRVQIPFNFDMKKI